MILGSNKTGVLPIGSCDLKHQCYQLIILAEKSSFVLWTLLYFCHQESTEKTSAGTVTPSFKQSLDKDGSLQLKELQVFPHALMATSQMMEQPGPGTPP